MKKLLSNHAIIAATTTLFLAILNMGCDKSEEKADETADATRGNIKQSDSNIKESTDNAKDGDAEETKEVNELDGEREVDPAQVSDEAAEKARRDAEEAGKKIENMLREQLKKQGVPQQ